MDAQFWNKKTETMPNEDLKKYQLKKLLKDVPSDQLEF